MPRSSRGASNSPGASSTVRPWPSTSRAPRPEEITEKLNEVCEAVDTKPDAFLRAAAGHVLKDSEW
jgi:hypothetical protein